MKRRNFVTSIVSTSILGGTVLASETTTENIKVDTTKNKMEPVSYSVIPELQRTIGSIEEFFEGFYDVVHDRGMDEYGEMYNKVIISPKLFNALSKSRCFAKRLKSELRYVFELGQIEVRDTAASRQILANILNCEICIYTADDNQFNVPQNTILITNDKPSDRISQFASIIVTNL